MLIELNGERFAHPFPIEHSEIAKRLTCDEESCSPCHLVALQNNEDKQNGRRLKPTQRFSAQQHNPQLGLGRNDWDMTHLRPLLLWILLLAFSTLHYSLEFRQQPRGVIRFRVIPQPAQQPKPVARPEAPLI